MSNGLSIPATFPPKRQMTEETVPMKAIVVTDQAAGTAGMKLVERPEPQGAALASLSGANYGDVIVQVHASGFTGDELAWPSTWIDRLGRDRTPSIPGHELAGGVTALSYGTTGVAVGERVFGLTDWTRDGTLAEYVAVEARNLAPLPGDVDFTVGAALVMPGLTAWQGLFEHGRLQAGQSVLVHGAAGVVGSMANPAAPAGKREAGDGWGWNDAGASMADDEHVAMLKQGVAAWNAWRYQNPNIRPDLSEASLSGAKLAQANLREVDLSGANLREADLSGADLGGAYLLQANLSGADLREADLRQADLRQAGLRGATLSEAYLFKADLHGADLRGAKLIAAHLFKADLSGADLRGVNLFAARLVDTDLRDADLTGCFVYGVSAWGLKLEGAKQQNLIITNLVENEPEITVDNLEVAQFIYL